MRATPNAADTGERADLIVAGVPGRSGFRPVAPAIRRSGRSPRRRTLSNSGAIL